MIEDHHEIRSFARKFTSKARITRYQAYRLAFLASILLNIMLVPINSLPAVAIAAADNPVNVWWPTDGAHVSGLQPFKAQVSGLDVGAYDMYWQVDGGGLVLMDNNSADYPHKEAAVDLNGWTWHGSGPYSVTFVAKQGGSVVAQSSINLWVDNGLPAYDPTQLAPATQTQVPAPTPTPAPAPTQTQTTPTQTSSGGTSSSETLTIKNNKDSSKSMSVDVSGLGASSLGDLTFALSQTSQPAPAPQPQVSFTSLSGSQFYVDPNSDAAKQEAAWQGIRPTDAAKMSVLAAQSTAAWFGGWNSDIQGDTATYVDAASSAGKVAVLVAYNIPGRDCGGYSSGGASSSNDYLNWIGGISRGIGNRAAVVILEPDALAGLDCLSSSDQAARLSMMSSATSILKSNSNTKVYLDSGNSTWHSAADMAPRLMKAGISQADGFSLNVSGFETTDSTISYGEQISSLLGGKHFVIDTSRNGNGSNGQWCNPSGRAIGNKPTTQTGNSLVDAFLWVKTPGESDGNCNGGPSAGVWWPDYALSLVP